MASTTLLETTATSGLLLVVLFVVSMSSASPVVRHSACQAVVNRRIINLQPLQRTDGLPRFKVEYNGWNFTFNPCVAFNYPQNPSKSLGDQCHYVAMCKSRYTSSGEESFAVGLQRTARFKIPSLPQQESDEEDGEDRSSLDEEDEESSEEEYGEDSSSLDEEDEESSEEEEDGEDSSSEEDEGGVTVSYNDEDGGEDEDDDVIVEPAIKARRKRNFAVLSNTTSLSNQTEPLLIAQNATTIAISTPTSPTVREPLHRKEPLRKPKRPRLHKMMNTTFLIFKGERTMRHQRVYVALYCDHNRILPEDALFRPFPLPYFPNLVFELHHKCCCPDACGLSDLWPKDWPSKNANISEDAEVMEAKDGPRYMWLIFVINLAVLIVAICIGAVCCRKGGANPSTYSPYSYLPALHSSHLTLNSIETTHIHSGNKTAEYLDYSSNIIRSQNLPKLNNCVIPSHCLEIGQRLGGGVFGDTYLADWKDRAVAAKRITAGIHSGSTTSDMEKYIVAHTIMLSKQRHKHLVSVLGVCTDLRQVYMITEFVEGDTFKEVLFRQGEAAMRMSRRIKVCIQAADGIAFLHSAKPPILHRDFRAANILIDRQDRAKVVDYGMIKITQRLRNECPMKKCFCSKETSALPAFIRWSAPEVLANPKATEANFDVFSPSCDVYSFGMVLWEVVSITDPFEEIGDDSEVKDIVCRGGRPRVDLLHNLFAPYMDLMCSCWDQNPDMRPTFKKCAVQLKTILHLCNKHSHIVADNYSLRGSLPNLNVASEKVRRKVIEPSYRRSSSVYDTS